VFSAYLLMQAATTTVFGELTDRIGRSRVFVAGMVVFLRGSLACGLATPRPAPIALRLVQDLGGSRGAAGHRPPPWPATSTASASEPASGRGCPASGVSRRSPDRRRAGWSGGTAMRR
jgi:MFS family permease